MAPLPAGPARLPGGWVDAFDLLGVEIFTNHEDEVVTFRMNVASTEEMNSFLEIPTARARYGVRYEVPHLGLEQEEYWARTWITSVTCSQLECVATTDPPDQPTLARFASSAVATIQADAVEIMVPFANLPFEPEGITFSKIVAHADGYAANSYAIDDWARDAVDGALGQATYRIMVANGSESNTTAGPSPGRETAGFGILVTTMLVVSGAWLRRRSI